MVGTFFRLDGRRRSTEMDEHTMLIITHVLPHGRGQPGLPEIVAVGVFSAVTAKCTKHSFPGSFCQIEQVMFSVSPMCRGMCSDVL